MEPTLAKDADPAKLYRPARRAKPWERGTYLVRATKGEATRLVRRLTRKVKNMSIRTDESVALRGARGFLAGEEVLFRSFRRWTEADGEKREMRHYMALPNDYRLRELSRPPGYGRLNP